MLDDKKLARVVELGASIKSLEDALEKKFEDLIAAHERVVEPLKQQLRDLLDPDSASTNRNDTERGENIEDKNAMILGLLSAKPQSLTDLTAAMYGIDVAEDRKYRGRVSARLSAMRSRGELDFEKRGGVYHITPIDQSRDDDTANGDFRIGGAPPKP